MKKKIEDVIAALSTKQPQPSSNKVEIIKQLLESTINQRIRQTLLKQGILECLGSFLNVQDKELFIQGCLLYIELSKEKKFYQYRDDNIKLNDNNAIKKILEGLISRDMDIVKVSIQAISASVVHDFGEPFRSYIAQNALADIYGLTHSRDETIWRAARKAFPGLPSDRLYSEKTPNLFEGFPMLDSYEGMASGRFSESPYEHVIYKFDSFSSLREHLEKQISLGLSIGSASKAHVINAGHFCPKFKNFSGIPMVVKMIPADNFNGYVKMETGFIRNLCHPNIAILYYAGTKKVNYKAKYFYYCYESTSDGSLFHLMHIAQKKLSWLYKLGIMIDIFRGLSYLHNWQEYTGRLRDPFLHCYLKSKNILIDRGRAKLMDIGTSAFKGYYKEMCSGLSGSVPWMAQEIIEADDAPYTKASDIFSAAVVLSELITGRLPWQDTSVRDIISLVLQGQRTSLEAENVPKGLVELTCRCWSMPAAKRPSAKQALEVLEPIRQDIMASM